jgi:uncharacterized protein with FMN-binding domain
MIKKRYIILLVLVLLIVAISIMMWAFTQRAQQGLEQLSSMTISDPHLARLSDGVYRGEYAVFPVKVIVEVTVRDHMITNINLIEHRQGQGKAAEALIPRIVQEQRVTLDVVSGATYSSLVLLKAVEHAFQ